MDRKVVYHDGELYIAESDVSLTDPDELTKAFSELEDIKRQTGHKALSVADFCEYGGFKIDMIRNAVGCCEGCLACGVCPDYGGVRGTHVSQIKDVRSYLLKPVGNTGKSTKDFLNSVVTTDVITDPVGNDILFPELAELVAEFGSRIVAITHGLNLKRRIKPQEVRLKKISDLLSNGTIASCVLSVDQMRLNGKMPYEDQVESYVKTLEILGDVADKARITVSLQGDIGVEKLSLIGTVSMLQDIMDRLRWGTDKMAQLNIYARTWIPEGRALQHGLSLDSLAKCNIIPDPKVEKQRERNYRFTGRLGLMGEISVAPHVLGATYNVAVKPDLWLPVDV